MIDLRNNKGITLMAQVITVVLIIMLLTAITYSSTTSIQVRNLNKMYSDIINIQEKVFNYYLKYNALPINDDDKVSQDIIDILGEQKNPNDDDIYYKIDMTKLLNITLNYKITENNFYFINTKTLNVYYSAGVEVSDLLQRDSTGTVTEEVDKIYYTLPSNYTSVNNIGNIVNMIQTENLDN